MWIFYASNLSVYYFFFRSASFNIPDPAVIKTGKTRGSHKAFEQLLPVIISVYGKFTCAENIGGAVKMCNLPFRISLLMMCLFTGYTVQLKECKVG